MTYINTSECESCIYSKINDTNKARVTVHCTYRDKTYYYGQRIPCEDKEKKRMRA